MSKRILLVEDQPDNRQIIRDMLAPTDYESTEVENGEEALAAIAKQADMPQVAGRRLVAHERRQRYVNLLRTAGRRSS
jgi:CheY-like chemotaxis protein